MLQHIVLISCCLLAIGDSTDYYTATAAGGITIFLSQPSSYRFGDSSSCSRHSHNPTCSTS